MDWWFAARWRALIAWVAFACISAAVIDSTPREWVGFVTSRLWNILRSLIGYSPPAAVLEVSSVFGLMCWFQPVCLRLGIIRSALWIVIYVAVGLAIHTIYPLMAGRFGAALFDALLLMPLFSLPGLAAIGVRTRPWLSPCASILSSIALYVLWSPRVR
jgi:hypothetical protein